MRVYDLYGSADSDLVRLKDQVAAAAGLTLTYRESSYIGDYYETPLSQPQKVQVMRNLDALDGEPRWTEWAQYKLIIEAGGKLPDETASPVFLDNLREALSAIPGLVHISRSRPQGESAPCP